GQPERDEEAQHQRERPGDPHRPRAGPPWRGRAEMRERLARHALPRFVTRVNHAATTTLRRTPSTFATFLSRDREPASTKTAMPRAKDLRPNRGFGSQTSNRSGTRSALMSRGALAENHKFVRRGRVLHRHVEKSAPDEPGDSGI